MPTLVALHLLLIVGGVAAASVPAQQSPEKPQKKTPADKQAEALQREMVAAYKAAQTLSGTFIRRTVSNHSKAVSTIRFELQKPNLARFVVVSEQETGDGKAKANGAGSMTVSDGKYVWIYDKAANTYSKVDVDPNGAIINALDSAALLSSFFTIDGQAQPGSGNRMLQGIAGAFGAKAGSAYHYVGRKTIGGKQYDVLQATIRISVGTPTKAVLAGTTEMDIGQDKLIHRTLSNTQMIAKSRNGSFSVRDEEVMTALKVNKPIPASEFTFVLPKGAVLQSAPPGAALKSNK